MKIVGNPIRVCVGCVTLIGAFATDVQGQSGSDATEAFSPERFRNHVKFLASDDLAGRAPGSDGSAKAREYITRHFEKFGLQPLAAVESWHQEFSIQVSDEQSATARNILGVRPGQGRLKKEAIVICAHYDHLGFFESTSDGEDTIFNGAADNASGVSALLLMADALNRWSDDAKAPRRSVIFVCFDAEERGLKGAHHYVQHPPWPLEQTAAVINLDDIGHLRQGTVYASDAETSEVLAEFCRSAAKGLELTAETRFGGHYRSDHAVFLTEEIPAVHFFTGSNRYYHAVGDEWDTVNHEGGAQVAQLANTVLQKLVLFPEEVVYRRPPLPFDLSFALGIVRTLGVFPNVGRQEGSLPQILFVLPGSPAAKHGLKSGDQVAAIDGMKLDRAEDAFFALQRVDFRDGVDLSVVRDEQKIELVLPPTVFEDLTGPKAVPQENGNYLISFEYQAGEGVKQVYLAGEFNDWEPKTLAMDGPDDQGRFTKTLELEQGVYRYKFVIEGARWEPDPNNMFRGGQYNNSILIVGDADVWPTR